MPSIQANCSLGLGVALVVLVYPKIFKFNDIFMDRVTSTYNYWLQHTLQNNTKINLVTFRWSDQQTVLASAGSPMPGAKQYRVQFLCPRTPTVHRMTWV